MTVGGLVLLGWLFGVHTLTSLHSAYVSMKPNVALCFVFSGLAIHLLRNRIGVRTGQCFAFLVAVIALLTVGEYLFQVNPGIDLLLFQDTLTDARAGAPGRMALTSAFGFLGLGASLLILGINGPLAALTAQLLSLASLLNAVFSVIAYIYGINGQYEANHPTMALNSALLFVLLSVTVLFARPDQGLTSVITSKYGGGQMARHILPWAVTLPFFVGWIRQAGQRAGLYGTDFGLALFATSNIVMFTILVWIAARSLNARASELERSEDRFAFLADVMPQLIWTAAPDRNVTYCNSRWFDYTGITLEQSRDWGWTSVVHPDDLQNCVERWTKALTTESNYEVECRLKRASDNTYRWHLGRAYPLRNPRGEVIQWVGTFTDIEDQKQSTNEMERRVGDRTAELAQAQRRLQRVLDAATHISIIATDSAGLITVFNVGAERILGYPAEEVLGKLTPGIFHLKSEMIARGLELTAELGKPVQGFDVFIVKVINGLNHEEREWTYVRKDGSYVTVNLVTSASYDTDGRVSGFLGVATDITARKKAEEELSLAEARRDSFVHKLEQRNLEITLLGQMGDFLLSSLDIEEACAVIGDFAKQLFPSGSGALYLLDASRKDLHLRANWGNPSSDTPIFAPEDCLALRRGTSHTSEEGNRGLACRHLKSLTDGPVVCLPLAAQGETLGMVSIRGEYAAVLCGAFAEHLALALANLKLRETLRNQSIRDTLTGLFNRRFLEESLDRELKEGVRSGHPVGVILLDIDHFKKYNDVYGHAVGDAVLSDVGAFLLSNTRGEDVACRYGGEEFAVVLPGASLKIAVRRAEQLQQKIKLVDFRDCGIGSAGITISMGVAAAPDHGSSMVSLLKVADTALYKAKTEGRDRVVEGVLSLTETTIPDQAG